MYGPETRRFFQTFARFHGKLLLKTRGRPASLGWGQSALVLETIGRKSGQLRAVPLLYMPDGNDFIVLGSNYGQEHPPAWWFNLQARPEATVLWKGWTVPVRANVLEGPEREALIPAMREYNAQWRMYLTEVHRHLPIVRLERTGFPSR